MKLTEILKLGGGSSKKAEDWIKKMYEKYPVSPLDNRQRCMVWGKGEDQTFSLFELVPSMSAKDAVEVKWFQAYPLRKGVGTRAMKQLQDEARADGIKLTLFPWEHGQITQTKLIKFYKSVGFKPINKGGKVMIWEPPEHPDLETK